MIFIPKRYTIILLVFCGFMVMKIMESSSFFYYVMSGDMNLWEIKSEIRAMRFAYNFGCCLSLVGGVAATRYGGATVLGCGILLSGFLNLLIPVFRNLHSDWVLMFKFVQGSLHAISTVAIADTWSRWFPIEERPTSVAIVYTSFPLATVIFSKTFTYSSIEYLHHIAGGLAIIWAAMWLFTVKNHPSEDEKLSTFEKQFFAQKVKFVGAKRTIPAIYPWTQILNCVPFWALNACVFIIIMGKSWNISNDIYININEKLFTYFVGTVCYIIVGLGSDYIRNRNIITSTTIYKFSICAAFIGEAFALLISINGLPFNALMYFCLRDFFYLIIEVTLFTNLLDISPKYAGLLYGIQKFFSVLGDVFWINEILDRISSYVILWFIVILYLTGAIIFYVWGSGETQPWDGSSNEEEELDQLGDEV